MIAAQLLEKGGKIEPYREPHKVSGLGANKKPFLIFAEI
jgi:hypothetical protein